MLDGAIRLDGLAKRAAELGMPAVALTDHGNMFGALQLAKVCDKHGIKPIFGCELSLVRGDRKNASEHGHHVVLLAANQEGYRNLVELVSLAWVEGMAQGTPRIDLALLREHHKGLVGLSACMGGFVAQEILLRGKEAGLNALALLRDALEPGAFYAEVQNHGFVEQGPLNKILVECARALNLPLVASNDCHYLEQSDFRTQQLLQCIASGQTLEELERSFHGSDALYLRSAQEMAAAFKDLPDAIKNTLSIAERCAGVVNPYAQPQLPRFQVPDAETEQTYLRKLAARGLNERFAEFREGKRQVDENAYHERLELECDTICRMGFAGYFLIVQDFINWAKVSGIPVGPGRGSGAGSIVAYALRITDLDPIPYGLLFERFLNPERVSMPDFDIDFCQERRDQVIDYVRGKFGHECVGQIATFHQLKSKSVVRDVGRAMKMTPQQAGRVASMIPEPIQGKTVSIAKALEQEVRLKQAYESESEVRELLDRAQGLEDLTRHAGMHAAGVVISEGPLWKHVPVFCPEPGVLVTQFHKDDVEAAGLVKFDFLGLKTLTVIQKACELIARRPDRQGEALRLDRIPMDDPATYALLQSGETTHVFQVESSGMQTLFKQLKPDCFEDIVAAVALYRPGPLGSGMVEDFIQRKHGRVAVAYPHACLETVLKPTYGVIVYQEQVMQAAQVMAGMTLGGADLLRRAMGKKKPEEMAKMRQIFVDGAVTQGYKAEDAEKVFELIDYFAGYGFNKSHSAAYALLTYQTAYLKAHFPVEFVCAVLNADRDKNDKVVRSVAEARTMGIDVLPPDVNESQIDFSVVYAPQADPAVKAKPDQPLAARGKLLDAWQPKVRFGLGGIKGVGAAALDAIFDARREKHEDAAEHEFPFAHLFDFLSRVDTRRVNKAVAEALIQCGAFDTLHAPLEVPRAQAFASIEKAFEQGRKSQNDRASGQTSLLGLLAPDPSAGAQLTSQPVFLPHFAAWSTDEQLSREKAVLGFFVSGHLLDRYAETLERFGAHTTRNVATLADNSQVKMGGMVENFRVRTTRTGQPIAYFDLEDQYGRVEVLVRGKTVEAYRELLGSGKPLLIKGKLRHEQDDNSYADDAAKADALQVKVLLDEASELAPALHNQAVSLRVRLPAQTVNRERLNKLRDTLGAHPGSCRVDVQVNAEGPWQVLVKGAAKVQASEELSVKIDELFGAHVCQVFASAR